MEECGKKYAKEVAPFVVPSLAQGAKKQRSLGSKLNSCLDRKTVTCDIEAKKPSFLQAGPKANATNATAKWTPARVKATGECFDEILGDPKKKAMLQEEPAEEPEETECPDNIEYCGLRVTIGTFEGGAMSLRDCLGLCLESACACPDTDGKLLGTYHGRYEEEVTDDYVEPAHGAGLPSAPLADDQ